MKIVIARPEESKEQDLDGLRKYLAAHKSVSIEQKENHVAIKCPENFVNPIIMLVSKYGYWASEYGGEEHYS